MGLNQKTKVKEFLRCLLRLMLLRWRVAPLSSKLLHSPFIDCVTSCRRKLSNYNPMSICGVDNWRDSWSVWKSSIWVSSIWCLELSSFLVTITSFEKFFVEMFVFPTNSWASKFSKDFPFPSTLLSIFFWEFFIIISIVKTFLSWHVFNTNSVLITCCSSKLVRFPPIFDLVSYSFCTSLGCATFSWTLVPLALQKFVCHSLLFLWFVLTLFGFRLGSFNFAVRSAHGGRWGYGGGASSLVFLLSFFQRTSFSKVTMGPTISIVMVRHPTKDEVSALDYRDFCKSYNFLRQVLKVPYQHSNLRAC